MNTVTGQVQKIKLYEKFTEFIKKAKEEKMKKESLTYFSAQINAAKSRLDTIKKNLEFADDRDTKEYCIYRLKAAELDLNRHLKYAKEHNLSLSPLSEESI